MGIWCFLNIDFCNHLRERKNAFSIKGNYGRSLRYLFLSFIAELATVLKYT